MTYANGNIQSGYWENDVFDQVVSERRKYEELTKWMKLCKISELTIEEYYINYRSKFSTIKKTQFKSGV